MPERQLPGLELTGFWDLGSDNWNVGMDSNLRRLSAVVGARVVSRVTSLPATPGALSVYIVPIGATNENKIALWDGPSGSEGWVYLDPQPGWHFYVVDEGINVQWTGTGWVQFAAGGSGGGGGGGASPGAQLYFEAQQATGQTINATTATLVFDNIIDNDDSLFNAADNTIRIPAAQGGRTSLIDCQTRHTGDDTGVVETTLEKSTDGGVTWNPIASAVASEEYNGVTRLTTMVRWEGDEWYRFRHTTNANKTTSGDAQTAVRISTVDAGQLGRIITIASTQNVVNPQFNAGDFTPWTVSTDSGTLKLYIPPDKESDHVLHPDGFNYIGLDGDSGGPWYVEQKIALPENPQSVSVTWDQHTRFINDMMRMEIDWLDASDTVLDTYIGTSRLNSDIQLWETFTDTASAPPPGTSQAMVRFRTVAAGGSQQLNITNFRVTATTLGVSGMLPGSVYAFLPELAGNPLKVLRVNSTGDDVEWGEVPLRVRAGSLDEPAVSDLRFVGADFTASKTGDTVEISFTGGLSLHGSSGEVASTLNKLTITGAGVGLNSPVAGEIEVTIPGPGESVPAATSIEEIDGIEVTRTNMSADQNGQPLIWDQATNAFIPLPEGFNPIAHGGGAVILRDVNLAGQRTVTLTDAADNLFEYDELHIILFDANDHADVAISTDGGSTLDNVTYAFAGGGFTSEGTTESDDSFLIGGWDSDVTGQRGYGVLRFFSTPGFPTTYDMFGAQPGSSGERLYRGHSINAAAHNAVIIQRDSSGNFTEGRLFVLGVKKTRQPVDLSERLENGATLSGDQVVMAHETIGLRLPTGDIGRIRVDPVPAADMDFRLTDRSGMVLGTATVSAGVAETVVTMLQNETVSDTLQVVAPATPDGAVTSVYVALRAEAG